MCADRNSPDHKEVYCNRSRLLQFLINWMRERRMVEAENTYTTTHNEYVTVARHALQDNITLCDSKCGILLGFGAVVLLWCLDKVLTLTGDTAPRGLLAVSSLEKLLYGSAVIALLITVIFAWKVIKPRIHHGHDHIYWGSRIFTQPQADFTIAVQKADPNHLAVDMLNHLHTLARICREKYANFALALVAAQFAGGFVVLAFSVQVGENLLRVG